MSLKRSSTSISRNSFEYVPKLDFNDPTIPWPDDIEHYHQLDEYLYKKFDLNKNEIDFIENNIKAYDLKRVGW